MIIANYIFIAHKRATAAVSVSASLVNCIHSRKRDVCVCVSFLHARAASFVRATVQSATPRAQDVSVILCSCVWLCVCVRCGARMGCTARLRALSHTAAACVCIPRARAIARSLRLVCASFPSPHSCTAARAHTFLVLNIAPSRRRALRNLHMLQLGDGRRALASNCATSVRKRRVHAWHGDRMEGGARAHTHLHAHVGF